MPPSTDMSPPQAAEVLGCSAPTVRALIAEGRLRATATRRGKRTFLAISSDDVEAYVEEFGTFRTRRSRGSVGATGSDQHGGADSVHTKGAGLVGEVRALRKLVEARLGGESGGQGGSAELVALREAVQLQRAAMAELLDADHERSTGMAMMQQAIASFERADAKRRSAIAILDAVVGSLTLPGTTEALEERPRGSRRS